MKGISMVVRLQHWMDSVPGQTFLNYAYSWGAAIVILGTLFKLTHIESANMMLFIGMGTEVVVFFLSAFDRPFDKSEDGKLLADDYETDEEIAASEGLLAAGSRTQQAAAVIGGGTIVLGGGTGIDAGEHAVSAPSQAGSVVAAADAAGASVLQMAASSLSSEMEEAAQSYVEELKRLTDTLAKVEAQSARLTGDSEEMFNLNRTLTGINTVYEVQLKSISSQVGTIDQVNAQTRKMAQQIEELNAVYARMIKALTVNMKNAATADAE